jgi:hypothetical protein
MPGPEGEIHSGDVVPIPDRSVPLDLTPEQYAAKKAEWDLNQAMVGAAGEAALRTSHEVVPVDESAAKAENPDLITSDEVPKPE